MKNILSALLYLYMAATAYGQSVTASPPSKQKVVRTTRTAPLVNASPNIRYVDPTSTTDLVDQVNTLFANCSHTCEVHIPGGNYGPGFTTPVGTDALHPTIILSKSTQRLVGDGQRITNIIDTNALPFIDAHVAPFNLNPGIVISGFSINCTNTAAVCITAGDATGFRIRDIEMIGPGGQTNDASSGTSQAIVLANKLGWSERWKIDDIVIGGFHTNLHFEKPDGGTDSFGYGQAEQITSNIGCGDHGVQVDSGANVYNIIKFEYQFNYGCKGVTTGTEVFTIGGFFAGQNFHVTGENAGNNYTFAHVLKGGVFFFDGDYNVFGLPNTGLVVTDATQPADGPVPFYIGTQVGTIFKSAGIPLLSNYDGSGESFRVTPVEVPTNSREQAARMGYLTSTTSGKGAVYDAFEGGSRRCHFVRNQFQTEAALTPVWCVDAAGNTTQTSIKLGPTTVISSFVKYSVAVTPAAVPASTCRDQVFTAPGMTSSDSITQFTSSVPFGEVSVTGYPNPDKAGQLIVHYCNSTTAPYTPPAATYNFMAIR
ncbi:hypothetical protein [Tunturiibacter lichenicola]|uniref:hypothetical protein n=1 Tax=Tunturiibacter lichenicola TaxID=2051959 RepID=UPI003D9BBCE2